jgi:hypothetical protein
MARDRSVRSAAAHGVGGADRIEGMMAWKSFVWV